MDWSLFVSTFILIFLAEIPDKTAFAIVLMATRKHPLAVFVGVGAAFVIQSLVAVFLGRVISSLFPETVMKALVGGVFVVLAVLMWLHRNKEEELETPKLTRASFLKTTWSSFLVIFIAEWGDLTQLATAALAAKHNNIWTILVASTLALWTVTALAIIIGNQARNRIHPVLLKKIAAASFLMVGIAFLGNAVL